MRTVVFYDIGGRIPNLALMKQSTFYSNRGWRMLLSKEPVYIKADRHVASVVFANDSNHKAVAKLRSFFGSDLIAGGSGISLDIRLSEEIDRCFPDYSLYGHERYALGFLTRGCTNRCSFCLVPRKEGALQDDYAGFDDFVPAGQKNVMLLDNNLLASTRSMEIIEEIIRRDYCVNFSQTLDIRHLDEDVFCLLKRTKSVNSRFTSPMIYFSCNSPAQAKVFYEKRDLLRGFGRDRVTVIMMFGYDLSLSQEYQVLSMLKELKLIPFLQKFSPPPGMQHRRPENYFDMDVDKIAAIRFRRNGQNNEKYFTHVLDEYRAASGKYYLPLLKARYFYNNKHMLQKYLQHPELISDAKLL